MAYDKDQIEALPTLLKFAASQPGALVEILLEAKAEIERLRAEVAYFKSGLDQSKP